MALDITLGRIGFVAPLDDVPLELGGGAEVVGGRVAPGERAAREQPLVLPVRADDFVANADLVGERYRRQVVSLLNNEDARQFLYLYFAYDSDVNGWLHVGGGELTEEGTGISFGEWKLTLKDAYRLGSLRTHRPARRLCVYDRRLSTTPRDYLRKVYGTDFAGSPLAPVAIHHLPSGASDLLLTGGVLDPDPTATPTKDGNVMVVPGRAHGEVAHFEQAEVDRNESDVLIRDRRGDTTNVAEATWEEVYGPDFPLSANDVPVLENGICRLRWVPAVKQFALDRWNGAAYTEVGRIGLHHRVQAGTTAAGYLQTSAIANVRVVEWTAERAVVALSMRGDASGIGLTAIARAEVYLSLQRGWNGPRVEAYEEKLNGVRYGNQLRFTPVDNDFVMLKGAATTGNGDIFDVRAANDLAPSGGVWADDTSLGTYGDAGATPQPILAAVGVSLTANAPDPTWTVTMGVQRQQLSVRTYINSIAYGVARKVMALEAATATLLGYIGAHFGATAGGAIREAEAFRAAGVTQVADATASGGQIARDTKTVIGDTIVFADPVVPAHDAQRLRVWIKARANTTGGTAGARLTDAGGTPGAEAAITLNTTSWAWYDLGEYDRGGTGNFAIQTRRITAATFDIDRVMIVPATARRSGFAHYDGIKDVAARAMLDCRAAQELVTR